MCVLVRGHVCVLPKGHVCVLAKKHVCSADPLLDRKVVANEINNTLPASHALGPGLQQCFRKPRRLAYRRCLPHTPSGAWPSQAHNQAAYPNL